MLRRTHAKPLMPQWRAQVCVGRCRPDFGLHHRSHGAIGDPSVVRVLPPSSAPTVFGPTRARPALSTGFHRHRTTQTRASGFHQFAPIERLSRGQIAGGRALDGGNLPRECAALPAGRTQGARSGSAFCAAQLAIGYRMLADYADQRHESRTAHCGDKEDT
jgi:hypothetical protein